MRDAVSGFLRGRVRPLMPRFTRQYNGGVKVKDYSLIDPVLGAEKTFVPDYEEELIEAIKEIVETGDSIVVVGGGLGVSSVHAYRQSRGRVTSPGKITVFEGGSQRYWRCKDTLDRNVREVDSGKVSVEHAVVGKSRNVQGFSGSARHVSPESLPECDVLVMDCEGSEISILEGMSIRPDRIVVESHECFEASAEQLTQVLEAEGYGVLDIRESESFEISVLTAEYVGGETS